MLTIPFRLYRERLLFFRQMVCMLLPLVVGACSLLWQDTDEKYYNQWQELFGEAQELSKDPSLTSVAIDKIKRAIGIIEERFPENSSRYQLSMVSSLRLLGGLLEQDGSDAEAVQVYSRAVSEAEKVFGPVHVALAEALRDLGVVYGKQADWQGALSCFERSLEINLKLFGNSHLFLVEDYLWLAEAHYGVGRIRQASLLVLKALFNLSVNKEYPYKQLGRIFLIQAQVLCQTGADPIVKDLFKQSTELFMAVEDNQQALGRVKQAVQKWSEQLGSQQSYREFLEWLKVKQQAVAGESSDKPNFTSLIESYYVVWAGLEKYRSMRHAGLEGLLRAFSAYFQDLAIAYQREANWDRMEACLREAQEFRSRAQSLIGENG